jgi:hypothetical protein
LNKLIRIIPVVIVGYFAGAALAQVNASPEAAPSAVLHVQLSPFTYHYTYDSAHSDVVMIGLEREHRDAKLDGAALFSNSFGQPCIYLYPWGHIYHSIGGFKDLSFKWSAGLIYGYKAPYENKVPLNYKGFSLGLVPALAYEFKPGWSAQMSFLGKAALMFQLNAALN